MDESLSENLLTSPDLLKKTLSSRGVKNPVKEASIFNRLLKSSTQASLTGKDLLHSLEALWDSVSELLALIERKITASATPNGVAEQELLAVHTELALKTLAEYQRLIEELRHRWMPMWGVSPRHIALSRAAAILTRMGLLRRQLYLPLPNGFWLSFHSLLQEAESDRLLSKPLSLDKSRQKEPSLAERYIAFALLEMISPDGIPSHEIRPLYMCFLHFSEHTGFVPSAKLKDSTAALLHIDLSSDRPPFLGKNQEVRTILTERQIDPMPTVRQVGALLAANSNDHLYVNDCAVMLSRATLDRTLKRLQERAKRKETRQSATGMACLWCGRSNMAKRLLQRSETANTGNSCLDRLAPSPAVGTEENHGFELSHEGINSAPWETLQITPLKHAQSADKIWEMVSNRRPIEDSHAPMIQAPPLSTEVSYEVPIDVSQWSLLDSTQQGLRLRGQTESAAQLIIGDPILLEFPEFSHEDYAIGLLRWKQCDQNRQSEIGLEVISQSGFPLRVSAPRSNTTAWFDALILTRNRMCNEPLIMLPNNNYHAGEQVMTIREGRIVNLKLGRKLAQTAAISIFQFDTDRTDDPVDSRTIMPPA